MCHNIHWRTTNQIPIRLIKPLPMVDENTGARIYLMKPFACDPKKVMVLDFLKVTISATWQNVLQIYLLAGSQVCYLIQDMKLLDDDNLVVCGQMFIFDLKGLTFGHFIQYTPSLIRYVRTTNTCSLFSYWNKSIPILKQKRGCIITESVSRSTERLPFHQCDTSVWCALKDFLSFSEQ